MSFGGFLAVTISLLALAVLVVTFPKPGKLPTQVPSDSTGLPTWHGPTDYDQNRRYSIFTFSFVLQTFAAVYAFKWANNTANIPKKVVSYFSDGISKTRTTTFNRLLAFYALFTALAALALIAFDIGKLWEAFGLWHNLWEVAILTLLNQSGEIKSVTRYVLGLGTYFLGVNSIVLFLNWPFDAVFFKFQGLIADFALVIFYTRIYLNTRKHIGEEVGEQLPLNIEEYENVGGSNEEASKPVLIEHPKQLLLLVAASLVHVLGNLSNTILPESATADLLFNISYTITFPLYVLYVYLDTHCASVLPQKRIYLPQPAAWKTAVIFIWSSFFALLSIRSLLSAVGGDDKQN
ncbi:12872_t:CDS:2 [Ambispora leptoticha]|uniref:12872_t:CDS:1 n=1 Tax=Ambispora leptoticha TaxID=144679 RepID=A0A9N8WPA3_9GLOM|nr:12872_t:CDS:2 [Ambispora leptoticha]